MMTLTPFELLVFAIAGTIVVTLGFKRASSTEIGKWESVLVLIGSVLLAAYAIYGLLTNGIYIPKKSSMGTTYSGVAMVPMFFSLIAFSFAWASIPLQEYDPEREDFYIRYSLPAIAIVVPLFMLAEWLRRA